MITV
ncbi:hypothetical protein ECEC4203_0879, partial [Escherichia coli EC4203]|jgi:hypothetical protein